MFLSNFCIQRPVFTIVINLILAILGLWAAQDLQIRQFPRLVLPSLTVVTAFPGAAAELVEREITAQLEEAIGAASGIDTMTSTSQQGLSSITVNFAAGTSPAEAASQVRAKVAEAQAKLPAGILAPVITQISTDGQPVLYLAFADAGLSAMNVTEFVRREMVPRLTAIAGVAQNQIIGERKYAMRLRLDPVRLAAFGVTVQDVSAALQQQNVETPGGQIRRPGEVISVLVNTALSEPAAFRNLVLRRGADGSIVRLSDVGDAVVGADQTSTSFRYGGKAAIAVGVVPQSGANPIEISHAVRALLPSLREAAPPGMTIELAFDTAGPVEASVDAVLETVVIAVVLVLLVIMLFLGSLRSSLVALVTIPLSLVSGFLFMKMLDFSINIFSLLAMVLAVGLVVDDAIVEVENVQRHVDAGMTPMAATFKGSNEVAFAVIATTITLASVFAPLGLAGGIAGQLFREFAFTLAITILISGFIARTLSPMMCGRLIAPKPPRGYIRHVDAGMARLTAGYGRVLRAALGHPWKSLLLGLLVVAATVVVAGRVPGSVSAGEDQAYVVLKFTGPSTASLGYLGRWTARAEAAAKRQPEVADLLVITGMPLQNEALAIVVFKPWSERSRTSDEITAAVMRDLAELPGLLSTIYASDPLAGVGAGQPVQWTLKTTGTYDELAAAAAQVKQAARGARLVDNVTTDLDVTTPKVLIEVDRAAAADVGVPVATIGSTIQALLGGQRAATFSYRGQLYNVVIDLPLRLQGRAETLRDVFVSGRDGALLPLRSLINIRETAGPSALSRADQMRSAKLGADPRPGVSVAAASAELKAIALGVLPPNVTIDDGGAARAMERTAQAMGMVMLLAFVFIYLVLSAQFESFRDPVIILLAVPLAICGAIFGLYAFGGSYNLYSVVGFVTLVGLIAKNGILITEFANQIRDEGKPLREALIEASELRLRPIVMTAVATVLGALPLAVATGAGAGGRAQIGIVITAGMTFGTLVSLFIVPVVYLVLSRKVRHAMVAVPDFAVAEAPLRRQAAE